MSKHRRKKSSGGKKPEKEGASPFLVLVALAAVLGGATWLLTGGGRDVDVIVTVPTLSAKAAAGHRVFKRTCQACHGDDGQGSAAGPPLIYNIYRPNHHGDDAIRLAVAVGVRQHHWTFGNMPPQPQVTGNEVAAIIAFIRETQRANGIQ